MGANGGRGAVWRCLAATVAVLGGAGGAGCQVQAPVSNRRLIEHQALIDFSGLGSPAAVESVHVTCAVPTDWHAVPPQRTALFAHQQWRSPSAHVGMGVIYVHLPISVSAKTLLWFAKLEYAKRQEDGRVIDEWQDDLGRSWFEAENVKYRVRGYAVTRGGSAWIVYFGYKLSYPPNPSEISLAARAADTVVPDAGPGASFTRGNPKPEIRMTNQTESPNDE